MAMIPDARGRFGKYGGRYVPETLMPAILELEQAYLNVRKDRDFQKEFHDYSETICWASDPIVFCQTSYQNPWRCKNLSQTRRPLSHRCS